MYVSVSVYDDGDLLTGCLDRIRDVLPEATVDVVDGRYETWPAENDNSTDQTAEVARERADGYYPDGPYPDEQHKHLRRLQLAPEGEWALFIDADERLERFDADALEQGAAYRPRIFNALVYSQTPISYWPRVFDPADVADIKSWDRYLFDVDVETTDHVTIVHRHDLRGREYRESKYQRFANEGRAGRYEDGRFEMYLNDEWDVDPSGTCPECGQESVVWSPPTMHGSDGALSRVGACVRGECWIGEDDVGIDEYHYLPNRIRAGLDEDPDRLRLELLAVECPLVRQYDADRFAPEILEHWVGENVGQGAAL